ncbi:hypothetical protein [Atopobacter sp. AH10]|nr:hypothetical protein [Atopobacter sp. AH10]
MTGATIFSAVNVSRYVCATCGYIEEWVYLEDIAKIKKAYELP